VNEPHEAICSDLRGETLNLVAAEHAPLRAASVELAADSPARVLDVVTRHARALQRSIDPTRSRRSSGCRDSLARQTPP
jgi:hypothetical protein